MNLPSFSSPPSSPSPHPHPSPSADPATLTRREAIKRAALMLGVAISPSILAGALQAQTASNAATGKPVYLTAKQFETAAAVAERIIPKTDTPGAHDVGVPAFIDLMYGRYMTPEEKQIFARGLAEVDAASREIGGRAYPRLSNDDQDRVLRAIADASENKEKTFYYQIKEVTLIGYFTSEEVCKNVLRYDPVPGRFDGCIPLSEVGNASWMPLR